MTKEREARGWSQSQAVRNLRAIYERTNGKEGGSHASLIRQWKEWESGRVRPRHWARYIAATFGTVAEDLFPSDPRPSLHLIAAEGMDTAELVARLQRSTVDQPTIRAVRVTVDRLCGEYRYRPANDLRREGQDWLRRMTRLLDERLTYAQHSDMLALAAELALLVGCVEYDAGLRLEAEATRQYALDLSTELDNRDLMGWAHEMSAWFAITSGDYHRAISVSDHGIAVAGPRGVSIQLAAQAAKAWARLANVHEVDAALGRGRQILEDLPRPANPDNHFVIDPAKWHFYEMDVYRNIGKDFLAQVYAEEVLKLGTTETGEERSPMRNAEADITLGVVAARAGDLDQAVTHGFRALKKARQSQPSLIMVGQELARELARPEFVKDSRALEFRAALAHAGALPSTGARRDTGERP
jgi:tetratricopeptide (TPR) repeat protein